MALPDFRYRDERVPHAARAGAMLRTHPDVRALIGRTSDTAAILLVLLVAPLSLAWLLRGTPWWGIGVVAFVLGAVISHALFVVIHDCTRNLMCARTRWNRVAALVANRLQVVPNAMSFRRFHMRHHAHKGDYAQDLDLPSRWEAGLIRSWFTGKAPWLVAFTLLQVLPSPSIAWNRLPALRAVVLSKYDALAAHRSQTPRRLRLLFDREMLRYSRIVRRSGMWGRAEGG